LSDWLRYANHRRIAREQVHHMEVATR